MELLMKLRLTI